MNVANTSTLRFNVSGGSGVVGSGVQATVQDTGILELAGSVSALSQPAGGRVNVLNTSTAATGLHITGTNQQVGAVDGTGTTQVEAGASSHCQSHCAGRALVIGGTASTPGLVTIAASDANGNPLATSSGLAVAGSIASSSSGSTLVSSSVGSPSSPASGGLTAASGSGIGHGGLWRQSRRRQRGRSGAFDPCDRTRRRGVSRLPHSAEEELTSRGWAAVASTRLSTTRDKARRFLPGFFLYRSSRYGGFGVVTRRLKWRSPGGVEGIGERHHAAQRTGGRLFRVSWNSSGQKSGSFQTRCENHRLCRDHDGDRGAGIARECRRGDLDCR